MMYKCKLTPDEYKELKSLAEKGRGEYVVGMLLERFKLYTSRNYSPDVITFKRKKLSTRSVDNKPAKNILKE